MTFFPSKRKENVRNCPGRAFRYLLSGTMKRKVFASEACCVMLASFRINGPQGDEVAVATALTDACTFPAPVSDSVPAREALEARRTKRVTMLKNTNAMKPIIRTSYRLDGAGCAGAAEALCETMLR